MYLGADLGSFMKNNKYVLIAFMSVLSVATFAAEAPRSVKDLCQAIEASNAGTLQVFLNIYKDSDISTLLQTPNANRKTALELAKEKGDQTILKKLAEYLPEDPELFVFRLNQAINKKDVSQVEALLKEAPNKGPNNEDNFDWAREAVLTAAEESEPQFVTQLLTALYPEDASMGRGENDIEKQAVYAAASAGNADVALQLLKKYPNLDVDTFGSQELPYPTDVFSKLMKLGRISSEIKGYASKQLDNAKSEDFADTRLRREAFLEGVHTYKKSAAVISALLLALAAKLPALEQKIRYSQAESREKRRLKRELNDDEKEALNKKVSEQMLINRYPKLFTAGRVVTGVGAGAVLAYALKRMLRSRSVKKRLSQSAAA
jgi:hypothetical protein